MFLLRSAFWLNGNDLLSPSAMSDFESEDDAPVEVAVQPVVRPRAPTKTFKGPPALALVVSGACDLDEGFALNNTPVVEFLNSQRIGRSPHAKQRRAADFFETRRTQTGNVGFKLKNKIQTCSRHASSVILLEKIARDGGEAFYFAKLDNTGRKSSASLFFPSFLSFNVIVARLYPFFRLDRVPSLVLHALLIKPDWHAYLLKHHLGRGWSQHTD